MGRLFLPIITFLWLLLFRIKEIWKLIEIQHGSILGVKVQLPQAPVKVESMQKSQCNKPLKEKNDHGIVIRARYWLRGGNVQLMYMTGTHEQLGEIGTPINLTRITWAPRYSLHFQHVFRLNSAFIFQLMEIRHETSFKTNDIVLHLLFFTINLFLFIITFCYLLFLFLEGGGGGGGVLSYTSQISMCRPNGQ